MGYFRDKPRRVRQRERAQKHELRLGMPHGPAALTHRPFAFREWRYVRLAVPSWHWDTGYGQGVFTIAGIVHEKMRLEPEQERALANALRWFNRRLSVPRLDRDERHAVFWFKFRALECRRRVTHLGRLLQSLGVVVETTESHDPGRIVYQDWYQIAAVPHPAGEPDPDAG